ncbi:hypothetical protein [Algicola sagamiensis]|uniref:hypothetical protein n=1 Tax=Algicola sagamiensis TaxID=163869 RepID=UPI000379349C|nr:hypothetical protein [Algicola sagamiensis]
MKKSIALLTTVIAALSTTVSADENRYYEPATLYGGVTIDAEGVLHAKALYACVQPSIVSIEANSKPAKVFIKKTGIDCRMVPWVQEFSINLKEELQKKHYYGSEIVIGNTISMKEQR